MASALIRANRLEISDKFPVLGFTVRTGGAPYFEAVLATAKTGKFGDGKIFITDLSGAVRIRTGERGEEAL
mgnify:CR=1 FL=1